MRFQIVTSHSNHKTEQQYYIEPSYKSNSFFTYITKQSFLVNNMYSAAGTRDKHNYLDTKAYSEGQKGAA